MSPYTIKASARDVIAEIGDLIAGAGASTCAIGGTIGFRVLGVDGGAWIVDLDEPGGVWSVPDDPEKIDLCSTRVYAYASIFPVLLANIAAVKALEERGDLVIDGDREKLCALSRLMSLSVAV